MRIILRNDIGEQHSPIYDDPARRSIVCVQLTQPTMTEKHLPKEYELHVSTNDARDAIAQASSQLYDWLDLLLLAADEADDEESDFIQFARDIQGALGRHPVELSYGSEREWGDDGENASAFG